MVRNRLRWMMLSMACGGLVLGGGCGTLITDSLLRVGLAAAIGQGLQSLLGGAAG